MSQYMIDINLPASPDDEFFALIPKQRAVINELMSEGTITSYTLSVERTKLWVLVNAETESEVMDVLYRFPMLKFMRFKIHELMFHQMLAFRFPSISLN
jgi:muconolactone delta-isomerase